MNQMKNLMLRWVLAGAIGWCLVAPAFASAGQEMPEVAAKAYFAALQAGDWNKCASLMHPEALASMKRIFGTVIEADKTGQAAKEIFGLKGKAEYAQMGGAAVFERLMTFLTQAVPNMKEALAASTSVVLGQVAESPELVHLVYRSQVKMAGAEVKQVELLSVKKDGAGWRVLLTSDFEEMFTKMAESMAAEAKK